MKILLEFTYFAAVQRWMEVKQTHMRPIDADALDYDRLPTYYGDSVREDDVRDWISDAPTIDTESVRHGRWVNYTGVNGGGYTCYRYKCSECGTPAIVNGYDHDMQTDFCPWCGAKMDKQE